LIAIAPGRVVLTKSELMFFGTEVQRYDENKEYNPNTLSLAIKLQAKSIKRFTSGKLRDVMNPEEEEEILGKQEDELSRSKTARRQGSVAEQISQKVRQRRISSFVGFAPKKKKVQAEYYLVVVTDDESFRFFPFNEEEIAPLCGIITEMTGLEPFEEVEFIKIVIVCLFLN
jgi:hypothetical protein